MTPAEYIDALYATGVPKDTSLLGLDARAADLLKIDKRTARRYRNGDIAVPGPVRVALEALAAARAG